ncbi:SpoIIAA-like anti-anti-sigma regulatory factor [Aneurinibacillus soli]|uniref:Anti-sigma F factor antagonist n=1 Tax=Aneurinibacillus soli TaxID=1500254 RepID=A0A0U5AZC9_9BACL|nr:anti-sigma F factor antagonist [Aneurinibacillus soli]PYE62837.1 SpoIIAA-like anti-anti-sigma regulatory factor [Aneurinibacillus soli]BAU29105.1 Anti-sigma F factor antagonist [Aneurinibacillus soli]
MSLRVDTECVEDVLIVRLEGELDHHTAELLRHKLEDDIMRNPVSHLLLSLENLHFMDSSGLGVILGRYKQMNARGGDMMVCSLSPVMYRMFELSGLFKILKIKESEHEALLAWEVA